MQAWLATVVLASMLVATSAYHHYGHHDPRPHGDHDPRVGPGRSATAFFEMAGVRGEICFTQEAPGDNVTITIKLTGLEQFSPQKIVWYIYENPVRFSEYPDFPCRTAEVGDVFDNVTECRGQDITADCIGALALRQGSLDPTSETKVFSDGVITLFGPNSIIGRPIVLRNTNRGHEFACANIEYQGITLKTLRAEFKNELRGEVILRRSEGLSGTTLRTEVFPFCNNTYCLPDRVLNCPDLNWSLRNGTCDRLGPIFGSDTHADEIKHGAFLSCSRQNPRGCPAGDLTTKCGVLEFMNIRYRDFCTDDQLGLLPWSTIQSTVLVATLADGTVVDCAPWEPVNQLCARVNCIKRPRLRMDVLFFQRDPTDRTHVRSYITGLDGEKRFLQVRQNRVDDPAVCEAGGIYDKQRLAHLHHSHIPAAPLSPTGDVLPVGVMEHKTTSPNDMQSIVKQDTTSWLPLFGPFSIIDRSLALTDENGVPVACCNIDPVVNPSAELINSILGYQEQSN